MWKFLLLSNFFFHLCVIVAKGDKYIENFNEIGDISHWSEHSDTVRSVGKSKGSLVIQKTANYQRAILFTLLNPQPCGAAFAGVQKQTALDLSGFKSITLKVRGQGSFKGYKLILKEARHNYSFCNFFETSDDFKEVTLALQDFRPYFEGKLVNESGVALDLSKITSIGIQAYGGVYLPKKQSGVGSLEIDWIRKE
ncbi:uncharacterized protein LOC103313098 [Tribolium castaneum]|uniref:uncharacterized protein LOC103313098 n=1 Tax=Tribolium castaneum TaxID=7070 RepID=UPI00046C29F8|nr:PREDICTED: uncharacterized protein LOC103313098 [Tribolium castaneum]|eukprot:XP_008193692.1 PREDICTED: uncharacterized protein LOC103313098 [Tribolium castaneum]